MDRLMKWLGLLSLLLWKGSLIVSKRETILARCKRCSEGRRRFCLAPCRGTGMRKDYLSVFLDDWGCCGMYIPLPCAAATLAAFARLTALGLASCNSGERGKGCWGRGARRVGGCLQTIDFSSTATIPIPSPQKARFPARRQGNSAELFTSQSRYLGLRSVGWDGPWLLREVVRRPACTPIQNRRPSTEVAVSGVAGSAVSLDRLEEGTRGEGGPEE